MSSENYSSFTTETTLEDVIKNPSKYGAPTFEEFARNKDKWIDKGTDWFAAVDNGSTSLKRQIKRQIHKYKGWRVNSPEKMEQILENEGLDIKQMVPKPQVINLGGGWCDLLIEWTVKETGETSEDATSA